MRYLVYLALPVMKAPSDRTDKCFSPNRVRLHAMESMMTVSSYRKSVAWAHGSQPHSTARRLAGGNMVDAPSKRQKLQHARQKHSAHRVPRCPKQPLTLPHLASTGYCMSTWSSSRGSRSLSELKAWAIAVRGSLSTSSSVSSQWTRVPTESVPGIFDGKKKTGRETGGTCGKNNNGSTHQMA